ncbi:MAG: sugar transferase [Bacteroidia bacterium]
MRRQLLGLFFAVTDFLLAYAGWVAFYWIRRFYLYNDPATTGTLWEYLWAPLLVASYWVVLYGLQGSYSDPIRQSILRELFARAWITALGSLALFFLAFLDDPIPNYKAYRLALGGYLGLQWGCSWLALLLLRLGLIHVLRRRLFYFPTVIVGNGPRALQLIKELTTHGKELGYDLIGYITPSANSPNLLQGKAKKLGTIEDMERILQQRQPHYLILATEPQDEHILPHVLAQVNGYPVEVYLVPALRDVLAGGVRLGSPIEIPLVAVSPGPPSPWYEVIKRGMDIVFSILALIFLAPVMAIIAVLVRLSSPGPIIFRQERIGKHGRPFIMYKFRTMYQDAEKDGPALSRAGDPRITPIGRWLRKMRLDELPQFWNVLKGEMSLVGPRPERQYYIQQIVARAPEYKQLLKIRPGITSLGMVQYGYASSVEEMIERMRYDLIYLANRSLLLDIKILFYTILRVLQARGK